jgi:hypothetical protein
MANLARAVVPVPTPNRDRQGSEISGTFERGANGKTWMPANA